MNVIYLHGFKSSAQSVKGQLLQRYCAQRGGPQVHLPDLNAPPQQALHQVSELIQRLDGAALVGSSLGGFYAVQLAARHGIPAALINPAMQPWALFRSLFAAEQLPYAVTERWTLDEAQLDYLEQAAVPHAPNAGQILALLQRGDEVLDYRQAQSFFSQPAGRAMIISEAQGSHGMDDFAGKIPMLLQFLADAVQNKPDGKTGASRIAS